MRRSCPLVLGSCRVMIDGKRCSFTATTKSEAEKLAKDCKLGYTMPKKESEKNTVSAAD